MVLIAAFVPTAAIDADSPDSFVDRETVANLPEKQVRYQFLRAERAFARRLPDRHAVQRSELCPGFGDKLKDVPL